MRDVKTINKCAEDLAVEISQRRVFNIEEIKTLIVIKFKESIVDFIKEYATQDENSYQSLLLKQSKNRVGSKEYVSLGYELAAAKHRKATTNRVLNEIKKESKLTLLIEFVAEAYGPETIDKFNDHLKKLDLFN